MLWKVIDKTCFEKCFVMTCFENCFAMANFEKPFDMTCFPFFFVAYPCHKFFWWTPIVYIVLSVASLLVALATWGNVLLGHIGDSHHDEIWSHRWWDLTSLFSLYMFAWHFMKLVLKTVLCSFFSLTFQAGQHFFFRRLPFLKMSEDY